MDNIAGLLRDESGWRGKVRWHLNRWLLRHLRLARWVTVYDSFGAPGDALVTGIVCRHIAERFPGMQINCITPHPELLREDPHIAALNGPETYISLRHWYLDMIEQKQGTVNMLEGSMRSLGITNYDYQARVYMTETERAEGLKRLNGLSIPAKPVITINVRSREPVKTWRMDRWESLLPLLRDDFDVVQLGDGTEPQLEGVRSFAGKLGLRESMAVLSHARAHIGPDSFLMHAANGLGVP